LQSKPPPLLPGLQKFRIKIFDRFEIEFDIQPLVCAEDSSFRYSPAQIHLFENSRVDTSTELLQTTLSLVHRKPTVDQHKTITPVIPLIVLQDFS